MVIIPLCSDGCTHRQLLRVDNWQLKYFSYKMFKSSKHRKSPSMNNGEFGWEFIFYVRLYSWVTLLVMVFTQYHFRVLQVTCVCKLHAYWSQVNMFITFGHAWNGVHLPWHSVFAFLFSLGLIFHTPFLNC